jgi:hypothetical protein
LNNFFWWPIGLLNSTVTAADKKRKRKKIICINYFCKNTAFAVSKKSHKAQEWKVKKEHHARNLKTVSEIIENIDKIKIF